MPAQVALITPFAFPSVRGNAITVERIARGLRASGVDLQLWDLSVVSEATVEEQVSEVRPILVHAFHAFRVGPLALRLARRAEVPLLVTITGTDANHDLFDPERAPIVRRVLEGASAVTVFHESMAARIIQVLPDVAARLAVVPQSAFFEQEAGEPAPPASARAAVGPRLLFPAGIRMVKNPRFPLQPLDAVAVRQPGLELSYVGPILDPREGEAFLAALRSRPWARYLGLKPHHQMRALIADADVVLNCSLSEGGMANSVLEALALGRAVLASNIEGNRSLVEDGVTGLLFSDPVEFAGKAERLLGDSARARAERFGRQEEIDSYADLYARVTHA